MARMMIKIKQVGEQMKTARRCTNCNIKANPIRGTVRCIRNIQRSSPVGRTGFGQRVACATNVVPESQKGNANLDNSALPKAVTLEVDVEGAEGEAQCITLETGEIGRQAAGAVTLTCGETVLYCTACAEAEPEDGIQQDSGMVPLTVVYAERFSAAGRTSGGYLKRDGRPRDQEVLTSRLIDRPIRPMFPKEWIRDTQVLTWLLSYDGQNKPEPLAITAAGAALAISDIPISTPVAGVRVARLPADSGFRFVVNPTAAQLEDATLDVLIAGTSSGVLMIEGSADLVPSEVVLEAVEVGHKAIKGLCASIAEWAKIVGKRKRSLQKAADKSYTKILQEENEDLLREALSIFGKQERAQKLTELKEDLKTKYTEGDNPKIPSSTFGSVFKSTMSNVVRTMITEDKVRIDGRKLDEIRPITSRAHVFPRTHGSALFTRGETQAVAVVTLGDDKTAQRIDSVQSEENDMKRFYLQYFFPPSSVGETGRVGAPGRRELGHGELAERALAPVIPSADEFPYTMRVESTITESNGSSSMATVCGGTLALLDAGVPLKTNVAGVAMGLILNEDGSYVILSDILGNEDALGDMDFKVAGDAHSITSLQMDIKVEGITIEIMQAALQEAEKARAHLLQEMEKCNPAPRLEISEHAPAIHTMEVDPQFLGMIIGSGGKSVKQIVADFQLESVNCNVEGKPEGTIEIVGNQRAKVLAAIEHIESMCRIPQEGDIYSEVPVVQLLPFGCLVEYAPGKQALCHISEMANERIDKMEDVVSVGDKLNVKVLEASEKKVRVSVRHLLPDFDPTTVKTRRPERSERNGRNGDQRGGRDSGRRRN